MSKAANAVRETRTSLATVLANANLRRLNLALVGSAIGDWAYATAILIWAYDYGGVRAVGIWYTVRLILRAIVTPFAATLADRFPRRTVMVSADLIRAVIAVVVAVLIWSDVPAIWVFVLATIASMVSAPFRPAVAAILPTLVASPEELTAANGTTATIDSLSAFVGPALGGVLVAWVGVPFVVVLNALSFLWSAVLLLRIRVNPASPTPEAAPADSPGRPDPPVAPQVGFRTEVMAGFTIIWRDRDLRLISGVYAAQTVVAGASAVFMIEMAVQMTSLGSRGVGYLDSVMGVGAVLGGLLVLSRASARRLASDFGFGVLFWAVPLFLTAIWPQAWAAFLAMFIIGVANPVADVNADTILQRKAPDEVMGRVFGALETALIGSMALGAAAMPLLIESVGLRWALGVLALIISVAVLPAFGRLRRMDAELREPEGLGLLREIPMFAPVEPKALELMAQRMVRLELPAGELRDPAG